MKLPVWESVSLPKSKTVKFSIGDKVIVKHTKEEGKVIQIINNEMVELEVLNTRFPAFADELDHPYLKLFTSKKMNARKRALNLDDFPSEKPGTQKGDSNAHKGLEPGFYFSVIPVYFFEGDQDQLARLKLYFINQTEYTIKLRYDCQTNLGKEFTLGTTIYPFQHLYLHHIKFDLVNEGLSFDFKLESIAKVSESKQLEHHLKIKPKSIFQRIHQLEQSGEPMFSVQIASDFPRVDLSGLKASDLFAAPAIKPVPQTYNFKKRPSGSQEIDLHIEQLVVDYHTMSNAQKLEAQLQACELGIINAYHNQMPSVVIIHGIGAGKLKEEVHRLLKSMKKQVRQFENKYSQKYGFGATEVFLRYI
ncbi:MAG: hypothetical protein BGO31_00440 [Bacteroidetes bacterium 43-16]|nr:MAG: hypothetical protein BGO31_00440 [Bacteroidetes bacterium 43-16]